MFHLLNKMCFKKHSLSTAWSEDIQRLPQGCFKGNHECSLKITCNIIKKPEETWIFFTQCCQFLHICSIVMMPKFYHIKFIKPAYIFFMLHGCGKLKQTDGRPICSFLLSHSLSYIIFHHCPLSSSSSSSLCPTKQPKIVYPS